MRITESQLRKIIREVIEETEFEEVESSPTSSDKDQQVEVLIRSFSDKCVDKNEKGERFERGDLHKFVDDVISVCCREDMPQGRDLQIRQGQVGEIISQYRNNGGIGSGMIVPEGKIKGLAIDICQELQKDLRSFFQY